MSFPPVEHAFYDESREALRRAGRALIEKLPAVAEMAQRLRTDAGYDAQLVRFLCPSCAQRLFTVYADLDAEGDMLLKNAGGTSRVRSSDPVFERGGLTGIITATVEVRCRNGCHYRGRHRHERLLRLYCAAVELGRHESTLPS